MQDRRAVFAFVAGTVLAGQASAKPRPEIDDAEAPGVCPRCGRLHGKADAQAGAKKQP